MATALPIDPHLPAIARAMTHGNLVLVAPPGAGKTTRVPPAVLAAGAAGDGAVVVLEPRRIAARMAARRVAAELGGTVGDLVGYEVRFERVTSAATRIDFVTEGLLARRLLSDPELRGVGVVLLDEFHERHLAGDLALTLLRRLQRERRPDLRIAVMSATMDPAPAAAYLDAEVVTTEGRAYPIELDYLAQPPSDPLEREVARAVRRLLRDGDDGDVLVFLPGAGEIARAERALAELAGQRDLLVVPLHGGLSAAAQDRAVAPASRRKVILATNVAETSLTIDGVAAVVDSGLARIARHSPWSGLASLQVEAVSRASAAQRAGRAGRTRAGRCLRLYTRHDHDSRRAFDTAEILRADLAEAALSLHASGVARLDDVDWFEAPPPAALAAADDLLARLGAIDPAGAMTPLGARLLRFPVHPRQARILAAAEDLGVAEEACLVAAVLGERDVRSGRRGGERRASHTSDSDVIDDVDALSVARGRGGGVDAGSARAAGLDLGAAQAALRAARQLSGLVDRRRVTGPSDPVERERLLRIAILAGYPDRVARRRRQGSDELILADGTGAVLSPLSAVQGAELMVALDAEERGKGRDRRVTVRSASAIESDFLLELFLDRIAERDELVFEAARERVVRLRQLAYDALILDESRDPSPRAVDRGAAGPVLAAAARERGIAAFVDAARLAALRDRLAFVATACPNAGLAPLDDAELDAALVAACDGLLSFAELREQDLLAAVWAGRGHPARALLDKLAPEHVTLPGRRRVAVHYQPDQPPWIASRLQDFFGLDESPRVAGGAVALTLHLLAPNQRAVQVTSDLARFWQVHYPDLRRQLMRRYPRHAWPERP